MKNKLLMPILAFGLMASTPLHATPGETYAGLQYALGSYNEDGFDEVNPNALVGRMGKYINEGFSIEGRLAIGLEDDSINYFGTDITLEINTILGVYGLGHVKLNQTSSVYGLIGFTRAEATVSAPGFGSSSDDETGLSFGVGAELGVGNNASLNIEYLQYFNKSEFDFSTIGLGVVFGF